MSSIMSAFSTLPNRAATTLSPDKRLAGKVDFALARCPVARRIRSWPPWFLKCLRQETPVYPSGWSTANDRNPGRPQGLRMPKQPVCLDFSNRYVECLTPLQIYSSCPTHTMYKTWPSTVVCRISHFFSMHSSPLCPDQVGRHTIVEGRQNHQKQLACETPKKIVLPHIVFDVKVRMD
jgi:hypothetical protein